MSTDLALASWMPPRQQSLLRVLCVGQDDASPAFTAWSQEADWEGHFDRGSFRLLPAVYRRIEALGIDDPAMGRLRGMYRRSWYRNQRYLRTWSKLHDELNSRGINVLLLGASALAAGYYRNTGERYVTGTDLLVRPLRAAETLAAMRNAGWHFETPELDRHDYRRRASFIDPLGEPGTLRWYPTAGWNEKRLDWFWGTAMPARADNLAMPVPGPAAMLLYLLAEMCEQEAWTIGVLLADVNTVIGHIDFDWQQLLGEARTHRLALALLLTIGCLRTTFGVSIPEPVLRQLNAGSSTFCERLELRLYHERQRNQESFLSPVGAFLAGYLRFVRGRTTGEALVRSPEFLRQYYGSRNLRHIVTRLLGNGVRRAARLLVRRFHSVPQHMTGAGR
jgi:hypothetical protein